MLLNFIFSKAALIIILVLSLSTVAYIGAETTWDTFSMIQDTIVGFFTNLIDAVKNGFKNIIDAIKGFISGLIPDIPSLSEIKDYVMGFFPNIPSMSDIWNSMKYRVEDLVDTYLIGKVFEPLTGWLGYTWNDGYSIPVNLYYAVKTVIENVVRSLPGMDWLMTNAEKIQNFLERYI